MTETTNWLLVAIGLAGLVLTIVVPLVAYFNNATNKTRNELSDHKTHVAETYATKQDVEKVGDRMERQMTAGFDNLKDLLINQKSRDTA